MGIFIYLSPNFGALISISAALVGYVILSALIGKVV
jgi:hypothetical protein